MLHILLRKNRFCRVCFPINAKTLVQNRDSSISLWMVIVVALILEDGDVAEDGEAVGETSGYEELAMVFFSQFDSYMLPIGR